MSFIEVIKQHWDQIHILSQLGEIIAQSSLERRFPNIEDDFFGDDNNNDADDDKDNDNDKYKYNLKLMYMIVERVIEIAKEITDLSDVHCVFYWISRQKDIDLDKLDKFATKIINLCDHLSNQCMHNKNNLIELNEFIEIEKVKHLTLKHLSYALDEDKYLNKSLSSILKSIEICSKTNNSIQLFNKMLGENTNQPTVDLEIRRLIENGEMDIREEDDIVCCYHFAANLCQKMNKFQQSLNLINNGISMLKNHLTETFKERIQNLTEPIISDVSDYDDDDDDEMLNEFLENDEYIMSVDDDDDTKMSEDDKNGNEYAIDMELPDDIKQMLCIKDKSWNDMDKNEKLFYFIYNELFDMLLTRGLAHSNLNEYKLAFYDAYLCTLLRPKQITALNNRAFAWYQLGKYINCIIDCNFALNNLPKSKQYSFTRGLLIGNRGLSEFKLKLYHKSVNDLNICLKYSPQSRLAREALHDIWLEFTKAIYYGCKRINIGENNLIIDIPFVIAEIIAHYGVGIDFHIIPQCHKSTIVYR